MLKKNLILIIFYFFTIQSSFGQGITDYKAGGANSPVSGSATNSGNQNAAPSLEKCEKNFITKSPCFLFVRLWGSRLLGVKICSNW